MTIQDLGALGELIGSVAVLATLVYLTIQMRQNTMSIRAQVEAAIMSTRIQFQLASASSKEIGEAWFDDEDRRKEVRRGHSIRG